MLAYGVILLIVFVTALSGSIIISNGLKWYRSLSLPPWTPTGRTLGIVWTLLYLLVAVSGALFWYWGNDASVAMRSFIIGMFLTNAALNVLWTAVFFRWHDIGGAVVQALCLELSILLLVGLLAPYSFLAALLLLPYACWVLFAFFLTFTVWQVNYR